jgi:hypothetical protein
MYGNRCAFARLERLAGGVNQDVVLSGLPDNPGTIIASRTTAVV